MEKIVYDLVPAQTDGSAGCLSRSLWMLKNKKWFVDACDPYFDISIWYQEKTNIMIKWNPITDK